MTRNEAIARIKKCLALSGSSNEHEAAAALRQAQALMRQFAVEEDHIAASYVSEAACKSGVRSEPPQHLCHLGRTIGNAFACDLFFSHDLRGQIVKFVGADPGPALAQYAYTVLRRALERDRSAYVATLKRCKRTTKIRRGKAFALTWVLAVSSTVSEFAGTDEDRERIASYLSSHYPALTTTPVRKTKIQARDENALAAGFRSGSQQSLRRPMSGGSVQKRITRG